MLEPSGDPARTLTLPRRVFANLLLALVAVLLVAPCVSRGQTCDDYAECLETETIERTVLFNLGVPVSSGTPLNVAELQSEYVLSQVNEVNGCTGKFPVTEVEQLRVGCDPGSDTISGARWDDVIDVKKCMSQSCAVKGVAGGCSVTTDGLGYCGSGNPIVGVDNVEIPGLAKGTSYALGNRCPFSWCPIPDFDRLFDHLNGADLGTEPVQSVYKVSSVSLYSLGDPPKQEIESVCGCFNLRYVGCAASTLSDFEEKAAGGKWDASNRLFLPVGAPLPDLADWVVTQATCESCGASSCWVPESWDWNDMNNVNEALGNFNSFRKAACGRWCPQVGLDPSYRCRDPFSTSSLSKALPNFTGRWTDDLAYYTDNEFDCSCALQDNYAFNGSAQQYHKCVETCVEEGVAVSKVNCYSLDLVATDAVDEAGYLLPPVNSELFGPDRYRLPGSYPAPGQCVFEANSNSPYSPFSGQLGAETGLKDDPSCTTCVCHQAVELAEQCDELGRSGADVQTCYPILARTFSQFGNSLSNFSYNVAQADWCISDSDCKRQGCVGDALTDAQRELAGWCAYNNTCYGASEAYKCPQAECVDSAEGGEILTWCTTLRCNDASLLNGDLSSSNVETCEVWNRALPGKGGLCLLESECEERTCNENGKFFCVPSKIEGCSTEFTEPKCVDNESECNERACNAARECGQANATWCPLLGDHGGCTLDLLSCAQKVCACDVNDTGCWPGEDNAALVTMGFTTTAELAADEAAAASAAAAAQEWSCLREAYAGCAEAAGDPLLDDRAFTRYASNNTTWCKALEFYPGLFPPADNLDLCTPDGTLECECRSGVVPSSLYRSSGPDFRGGGDVANPGVWCGADVGPNGSGAAATCLSEDEADDVGCPTCCCISPVWPIALSSGASWPEPRPTPWTKTCGVDGLSSPCACDTLNDLGATDLDGAQLEPCGSQMDPPTICPLVKCSTDAGCALPPPSDFECESESPPTGGELITCCRIESRYVSTSGGTVTATKECEVIFLPPPVTVELEDDDVDVEEVPERDQIFLEDLIFGESENVDYNYYESINADELGTGPFNSCGDPTTNPCIVYNADGEETGEECCNNPIWQGGKVPLALIQRSGIELDLPASVEYTSRMSFSVYLSTENAAGALVVAVSKAVEDLNPVNFAVSVFLAAGSDGKFPTSAELLLKMVWRSESELLEGQLQAVFVLRELIGAPPPTGRALAEGHVNDGLAKFKDLDVDDDGGGRWLSLRSLAAGSAAAPIVGDLADTDDDMGDESDGGAAGKRRSLESLARRVRQAGGARLLADGVSEPAKAGGGDCAIAPSRLGRVAKPLPPKVIVCAAPEPGFAFPKENAAGLVGCGDAALIGSGDPQARPLYFPARGLPGAGVRIDNPYSMASCFEGIGVNMLTHVLSDVMDQASIERRAQASPRLRRVSQNPGPSFIHVPLIYHRIPNFANRTLRYTGFVRSTRRSR